MFMHLGYSDNMCPLIELSDFVKDRECDVHASYMVSPIGCKGVYLELSTRFSKLNSDILEVQKSNIKGIKNRSVALDKFEKIELLYRSNLQEMMRAESESLYVNTRDAFDVNLVYFTTWIYKRKPHEEKYSEDFNFGGGSCGRSRILLISGIFSILVAAFIPR